eukprot:g39738.t1
MDIIRLSTHFAPVNVQDYDHAALGLYDGFSIVVMLRFDGTRALPSMSLKDICPQLSRDALTTVVADYRSWMVFFPWSVLRHITTLSTLSCLARLHVVHDRDNEAWSLEQSVRDIPDINRPLPTTTELSSSISSFLPPLHTGRITSTSAGWS